VFFRSVVSAVCIVTLAALFRLLSLRAECDVCSRELPHLSLMHTSHSADAQTDRRTGQQPHTQTPSYTHVSSPLSCVVPPSVIQEWQHVNVFVVLRLPMAVTCTQEGGACAQWTPHAAMFSLPWLGDGCAHGWMDGWMGGCDVKSACWCPATRVDTIHAAKRSCLDDLLWAVCLPVD